jgi:hypothetical protein
MGPFSAFAKYTHKVNYATTHTSIMDISDKRDTLNSRDASNNIKARDSWDNGIRWDASNRRDAKNRRRTPATEGVGFLSGIFSPNRDDF